MTTRTLQPSGTDVKNRKVRARIHTVYRGLAADEARAGGRRPFARAIGVPATSADVWGNPFAERSYPTNKVAEHAEHFTGLIESLRRIVEDRVDDAAVFAQFSEVLSDLNRAVAADFADDGRFNNHAAVAPLLALMRDVLDELHRIEQKRARDAGQRLLFDDRGAA